MRKRTHGVDTVHDQVDQDLPAIAPGLRSRGQISGKIVRRETRFRVISFAKQNGDLLNI